MWDAFSWEKLHENSGPLPAASRPIGALEKCPVLRARRRPSGPHLGVFGGRVVLGLEYRHRARVMGRLLHPELAPAGLQVLLALVELDLPLLLVLDLLEQPRLAFLEEAFALAQGLLGFL